MKYHMENQERLVELAYSRSTAALQAQGNIATAADQRSLVFSTLSVAAAALVFGALREGNVTTFGTGSALFFCLASVFGAVSALPGKVYAAGSKASELDRCIECDTPYAGALLGLCKNNDQYIEENERSALIRAHLYRFAVLLFLTAVGLSLIGFLKG